MGDSLFPEADREWLVGLIKGQGAKIEKRLDDISDRLEKLEDRQVDQEKALRNSTATDLEHEKKIAEAHERIAAIGAQAGKESGEAIAKKYGAIAAAILFVAQVVQSLFSHGAIPLPKPPAVTEPDQK